MVAMLSPFSASLTTLASLLRLLRIKKGKSVSSYFKGQLEDLMTTFYKTEPHFICCVVPDTHKQPKNPQG